MTLIERTDSRSREWTPEREAVLRDLKNHGLSASEIGEAMGATRNAIIGKLSRLGISNNENQDPWTDPEVGILKSAWATGITVRLVGQEILKRCGTIRSTRAIAAKADRMGLTKRMTTRRSHLNRRPADDIWSQASATSADFKPLNVGFMQLTSIHCREVTGHGHDGLATYCGHRRLEGRSFCLTHQKINYYKPTPMQRRF